MCGVVDTAEVLVSAETRAGRARALLADLLDWHRREDKPAWWRYFYLRTLSPAELTGEPDALGGLTGGNVVGPVKKSVVRQFRFPEQEHKFSPSGAACDPDTDKQWSVCDMDDVRGTIDLKMDNIYPGRGPRPWSKQGRPGPGSSGTGCVISVTGWRAQGADGADAATALPLRRPPDDGSGAAGSLRAEGETAGAAAARLAVTLHHSHLPMQGPPGTGKTYTAAEQIPRAHRPPPHGRHHRALARGHHTSSTPCTSTRGSVEPGRPGSASGRTATTRIGIRTPRR